MLHPERVHAFNDRVTDSPHPCERNASGPRARLSSVDSDRQGEPWHGLAWRARAGGLPRPLEGGTTGQRQPHRLFRAREKAQDRRSEPEACWGVGGYPPDRRRGQASAQAGY